MLGWLNLPRDQSLAHTVGTAVDCASLYGDLKRSIHDNTVIRSPESYLYIISTHYSRAVCFRYSLPLCRDVRSQILRPVLSRFPFVPWPAQVGRCVLRKIWYYVLVFRYALSVGAMLLTEWWRWIKHNIILFKVPQCLLYYNHIYKHN